MRATLEYIHERFDYFNKLIFKDSLSLPTFSISHSRTQLGQVRFRRRRTWNGKWRYSPLVLAISVQWDLDEDIMDDVIVHEMIHYYILSNQIQDNAPHGAVFRSLMSKINSTYGRHITIRYKTPTAGSSADGATAVVAQSSGPRYFCIMKLRDGTIGITVAAKTRLFWLWDMIPRVPDILEYKWYVSQDPFFTRFPRSQSIKIYSVKPSELEKPLKNSSPLVRNGRVITTHA